MCAHVGCVNVYVSEGQLYPAGPLGAGGPGLPSWAASATISNSPGAATLPQRLSFLESPSSPPPRVPSDITLNSTATLPGTYGLGSSPMVTEIPATLDVSSCEFRSSLPSGQPNNLAQGKVTTRAAAARQPALRSEEQQL